MRPERPRARRYPFIAAIELTDLESEKQMREKTTDLSVFGCHVQSATPFAVGAKVRIRMSHNGSNFVASARVVYSRESKGFGIVFGKIEPNDQRTLEKWIAELRNRYAETPA